MCSASSRSLLSFSIGRLEMLCDIKWNQRRWNFCIHGHSDMQNAGWIKQKYLPDAQTWKEKKCQRWYGVHWKRLLPNVVLSAFISALLWLQCYSFTIVYSSCTHGFLPHKFHCEGISGFFLLISFPYCAVKLTIKQLLKIYYSEYTATTLELFGWT